MTDKVQGEIKGDVATITLNKPERLNALDNEMWHGIGEACRAVAAAPDVRLAVLMGPGWGFCAGPAVNGGPAPGRARRSARRWTACPPARPWPASASTWRATRPRSPRWSRSACR